MPTQCCRAEYDGDDDDDDDDDGNWFVETGWRMTRVEVAGDIG
jgi:hypothetical protein